MATELTPVPTTVDLSGLPEPVVRSIHQLVASLRGALPPAGPPVTEPRLPLRGLFAGLGLSISQNELDEARREAWSGFPREFPEPDGS